jgi:DNA-directed RNA polymerase specialized sigma24 family protein
MKKDEIKNQMTDDGVQKTEDRSQKAEGNVEIKAMLQVLHREIQQVRMGVGHLSRTPHAATFPIVQAVEPPNDNEAARVFALLKALESETNYRKAPLVKVFQLFCLEAMTARQVARDCGCSVQLVWRRLREVRDKLGCKPSRLRALAHSGWEPPS